MKKVNNMTFANCEPVKSSEREANEAVIEHFYEALTEKCMSPFQTSNFTCAESSAIEKNRLFSLICIRFGTCKVRRLKRALIKYV